MATNTTSLAFDDLVVIGLGKSDEEFERWVTEKSPLLQAKIGKIVRAPNSQKIEIRGDEDWQIEPTSSAHMNSLSLGLATAGVLSIVLGIVVGFLADSSRVWYLGLIVGMLVLSVAVFLHWRRSGGLAASFGMAPSDEDPRWRKIWLCHQLMIGGIAIASMKVGLVLFLLTLVYLLHRIDVRVMPTEDSFITAATRTIVIGSIALSVWYVGSRPVFVVRCGRILRGFLAWRLPPFCVSWLYMPNLLDMKTASEADAALTSTGKIALGNWELLAIATPFLIYVGNGPGVEWLLESGNTNEPTGKGAAFVYFMRWMTHRPITTLMFCAILGSLSIAVYTFKVVKHNRPQHASHFGVTAFGVSVITFALLAYFRH